MNPKPQVASTQRHSPSQPCQVCAGHSSMPKGARVRCAGFVSANSHAAPHAEAGFALARFYLAEALRLFDSCRPDNTQPRLPSEIAVLGLEDGLRRLGMAP